MFITNIYSSRTIITTAGIYKDYTIGTTDTVNSRCRSIFQYRERLNLKGVHVLKRTFYTINKNKRIRITRESCNTTNPELSIILTRLSGRLKSNNTCQITN